MTFIGYNYITNPNGVKQPPPDGGPDTGPTPPPTPPQLSPEQQTAANKAFMGLGLLVLFMLGTYVISKP